MASTGLPEPPDLAEVLRRLGPDLVTLVIAPLGLELPVRGTAIAEADVDMEEGDLVAAVNVDADSEAAIELLERAGRERCAAVALKTPLKQLATLTSAAAAADVALLAVSTAVGWHHFVTLAGTAATPVGASGDGGEAAIGDLFTLAEATAVAVGGAVAIMDRYRRVVAYSSVEGQSIDEVRRQGILGRRVPPDFIPAHLDDRVWASNRPERVDRPGALPRLAIAVTAGKEPLGSIWAIAPPAEAAAEAESALLAAADIAALHLLKLTATPSALAWRAQDAEVRARLLGSPPKAPLEVPSVVLAAATTDHYDAADVRAVQVAGVFAMLLGTRPDAGCTIIDHTVFALMPADGDDPAAEAQTLGTAAAQRCAEAFDVGLFVGIGGPDDDPSQARELAADTLDVLRRTTAGGVATFDQVRTQVTLRQLKHRVGEEALPLPAVADMIGHDEVRSTEYCQAVLSFLEHSGNVTAAAGALYLHPNTLRYRIARAQELFGLRLERPDDRLLTWLKLRLRGID